MRERSGILPGGLWHEGTVHREYAFKVINGALELCIATAGQMMNNVPQAITYVLWKAIAQIGSMPATQETIRNLCVADRQFLMRELDILLGNHGGWLTAKCGHCGEHFDFFLDYRDLPVVPAGPNYPWVSCELSSEKNIELRIPVGADQESVLAANPVNAELFILQRCLCAPDDFSFEQCTDSDLANIDDQLDLEAPGVVDEVHSNCAHCGKQTVIALDPYSGLRRDEESLLTEVNIIARAYHWHEQEILGLPRLRRQKYLSLIEKARGMHA